MATEVASSFLLLHTGADLTGFCHAMESPKILTRERREGRRFLGEERKGEEQEEEETSPPYNIYLDPPLVAEYRSHLMGGFNGW